MCMLARDNLCAQVNRAHELLSTARAWDMLHFILKMHFSSRQGLRVPIWDEPPHESAFRPRRVPVRRGAENSGLGDKGRSVAYFIQIEWGALVQFPGRRTGCTRVGRARRYILF